MLLAVGAAGLIEANADVAALATVKPNGMKETGLGLVTTTAYKPA